MTEVDTNGCGRSAWSAAPTVSRRTFLRLASTLLTVWVAKLEGGGSAIAATPELQGPADSGGLTPLQQAYPLVLTAPPFTRNGANVPLVVEMHHPMETDHYIKSLQILNETDPIPSKGIFHLSPANGLAYLSVQARMNSGTSTVLAIAECTRHGRWTTSRSITIPEGAGGCASADESDDTIGPPVIRIPELVERGQIRRGDIVRVQINVKHPSRTGLVHHGTRFVQEADPFYLKEMTVLYGNRPVSRYEMTPAISDNPFITFTVRASKESTIRIVATNSRGQQFEATQAIGFA